MKDQSKEVSVICNKCHLPVYIEEGRLAEFNSRDCLLAQQGKADAVCYRLVHGLRPKGGPTQTFG